MGDLVKTIFEELQAGRISGDLATDVLDALLVKRSERVDAEARPLLEANTSTLEGQRFTTNFSGTEFFLAEHLVKGSRVLPGVAYLEMARAAVEASLDAGGARARVVLRNVVWLRPLVVDTARAVHIRIGRADDGDLEFEIYSTPGRDGGRDAGIVHAQGRAATTAAMPADERIDLSDLRDRCDRSIEVDWCYATFREMGLEHGAAYRGLTAVQVGVDALGGRFVLARIQLPACVSDTASRYVLHPSVMDSALQASMGVVLAAEAGDRPDGRPLLPFGLDELEILDRNAETGWAYVRESVKKGVSPRMQKVDIDVCDDSGRVRVRLRGFASRWLEGEVGPAGAVVHPGRSLMLAPRWRRDAPAQVGDGRTEEWERWVLLDPIYKECLPELAARWPVVKWAVLRDCDDPASSDGARAIAVGEQVLARLQSIPTSEPRRTVLLQVIVGEHREAGLTGALQGLFRAAHCESERLVGQAVRLSSFASAADIGRAMEENADLSDSAIRYSAGYRERLVFERLVAEQPEVPWKNGGVYWITGGAGALGLIFAREIADKVRGARIFVTGRSKENGEIRTRVDACRRGDTSIEYRTVDVADAAAVGAFVATLVAEAGALNGVIHSAGVTRDSLLVNKKVEAFREVAASKIVGTTNVDVATSDVELDFVILFSSVSAVVGNVGQADYAFANGYMDSYASQRNELVKRKVRRGRTLAINWPLWADGGMGAGSPSLRELRRHEFDTLSTRAGIDALYRAWGSGESQVALLVGDGENLQQLAASSSGRSGVAGDGASQRAAPSGTPTADEPYSDRAAPAEVDAASLLERLQDALIRGIARQLQVNADEIGVHSELSKFGFDSIAFTVFGNSLNETYGLSLSPTVFFEYPTLQSFAQYLLDEHGVLLTQKLVPRTATSVAERRSRDLERRAAHTGERERHKLSRGTAQRLPSHTPAAPRAPDERIAIVGISGRFPAAADVDEFWQNLDSGKDCISEIPPSRWNWRDFFGDPTSETNKTNVKWSGFIEGVDEFDPLFFGISPKEAQLMDPQQRLLMTHAWKAIEDAGHAPRSLAGTRTGIFVGTSSSGYGQLIAEANLPIEGLSSTGAAASVGPNRMSYFLDLRGPSEPIETACSSSLVALHRAVRAIQSGDCEMALVGGVNTILTPWGHISFSKAGMLSEDGRCKTFSRDANGYVRGEGVGMLFLKKLGDAERDRDHIYGLILGTAENHGGRASSLTAPNPRAQSELIRAAHREARIDPRTVTYIETHGTGTPLGDPIEIIGLKSAFENSHADGDPAGVGESGYCGLGSVKTNIGHLELAAGVAGVIKVLLQLKHKTLAKSLHCEEVNPYIELSGSPFFLVRETRPWRASCDREGNESPRRAGISSFGFGGVNAHVVVEEYCEPALSVKHEPAGGRRAPALFVLSAKNPERLNDAASNLLAHFLRGVSDSDLEHVAYTLQVGRDPMDYRLAFTAVSVSEVAQKLEVYLDGAARDSVDELFEGDVKKSKDVIAALNVEGGEDLVANWIARGSYGRALDFWVKGLMIDWDKLVADGLLYGPTLPKRVSLPTYPFARERYWVEAANGVPGEWRPEKAAAAPSSAPAGWLHVAERWQESALPANGALVVTGAQRVLLLYRRIGDADGFRRALAEIWGEGANRLLVECVALPVAPAEGEEERSLEDYLAKHRAPNVIFYFSGSIDNGAVDIELRYVLRASQVLIRRAGMHPICFHYCYPRGESTAALYQESLAGLFRAIAIECPAHRYRAVEHPVAASPSDYDSIVREWLQKPFADPAPAQLPMVRYRNGKRFSTSLLEVSASASSHGRVPFRRGATYLMVGALGEVGQLVCHELARQYRPRLVILSRRPLDRHLEQRLARLTDAGAEVLYRSVDITDGARLAETLDALKPAMGPIHGVFHFARSVADGPLVGKTFASFQQTIAAKTKGMLAVDEVTGSEPLEFFIAYSSMAAFGIEGSADYGYASAFQVAFVRARNLRVRRGERTGRSVALCWGQWRADAYSNPHRDGLVRSLGFGLIDETSVISLMEASLSAPDDVIGLMAVTDVGRVRSLYGLPAPSEPLAHAEMIVTQPLPNGSSIAALADLGCGADGDFSAAKEMLLTRSRAELAELYRALVN